MSNIQLSLGVGLPTLMILAALVNSIRHTSGIRKDIRGFRDDIRGTLRDISDGLAKIDRSLDPML